MFWSVNLNPLSFTPPILATKNHITTFLFALFPIPYSIVWYKYNMSPIQDRMLKYCFFQLLYTREIQTQLELKIFAQLFFSKSYKHAYILFIRF